jgi:hypothetical protein
MGRQTMVVQMGEGFCAGRDTHRDHRELTCLGSEKCEFRGRQPRYEERVTYEQEVVRDID